MRLLYDEMDHADLTAPGVDVSGLPIFEASAAGEWFWLAEERLDPKRGDMGRLRPGYQLSWWELVIPPVAYIHNVFDPVKEGEGYYNTDGERYGALVAAFDGTETGGPELTLAFEMFVAAPRLGPRPLRLPWLGFVPLTSHGDWAHWANSEDCIKLVADDRSPFTDALARQPELRQDSAASVGTTVESFLAGIGMANAKNIRTETVTVPPKVHRKRSLKLGRPAAETYQVIHLPAAARVRTPGEHPGAAANPRLRRVRGHLKSYGEDAPLFGRHVGSWWWSDRVVDPGAPATVYAVGRTPQ